MATITQKQMVLNHMDKYGKITSMEAFEMYGITRLAARVHDLKSAGYTIDSESKSKKNRFGVMCTYSEYKKAK